MADDAAHQSTGACTGQGTPACGATGNGCNAGTTKATDDCTTGSTLGGITHIGAAGTCGKHEGKNNKDACLFHISHVLMYYVLEAVRSSQAVVRVGL